MSDAGGQMLTPGKGAGFPASVADGHRPIHLRSASAFFLEAGDRLPGDAGHYSEGSAQ